MMTATVVYGRSFSSFEPDFRGEGSGESVMAISSRLRLPCGRFPLRVNRRNGSGHNWLGAFEAPRHHASTLRARGHASGCYPTHVARPNRVIQLVFVEAPLVQPLFEL